MRNFLLPLTLSMVLVGTVAMAAGWTSYHNGRYAYSIDIPPGFSTVTEADNGDGGVASSSDGRAELRVWGNHILDGDFLDGIAGDVDADKADGWAISYDRRKAKWASWSGSKAGRIFYQRSISACDGDMASFRLEYDAAQQDDYDDVVARLAKSLKRRC